MSYLIPLAALTIIVMPLAYAYYNASTGKNLNRAKKAVLTNLVMFGVICLIGVIVPIGGFVSAAAGVTAPTSVGAGVACIGSALAMGISAIGGGYAVAKGSAAAIGAISENSKLFGLAMVFVVLGEGIALYGMVIAIMILNHIH